jgi:hypothetical protein
LASAAKCDQHVFFVNKLTAAISFYNFRILHANSNDGCVDGSSIWWPQEKEALSADQFDQFYASEFMPKNCSNFCVENVFLRALNFVPTYFEIDDTNKLQAC